MTQEYIESLATTGACQSCHADTTGRVCVDCDAAGGAGKVVAGFTVPQLPTALKERRRLEAADGVSFAFRCHVEDELAVARCPADANPGECSLGYTGFLCQSCVTSQATRRCL